MIQERFEMLEVFSAYSDLPEGTEKEKWQEKQIPLKERAYGLEFPIARESCIMETMNPRMFLHALIIRGH